MQLVLESFTEINKRRQLPKDNLKALKGTKILCLYLHSVTLGKSKVAFPSSSGNLHISSEMSFSYIVETQRSLSKMAISEIVEGEGKGPCLAGSVHPSFSLLQYLILTVLGTEAPLPQLTWVKKKNEPKICPFRLSLYGRKYAGGTSPVFKSFPGYLLEQLYSKATNINIS